MATRPTSKRATAAARRSRAAKRGWATHRRQARERSERAKRGWETRRKNDREREKKKKKKKKRPPKPPPKPTRGEYAVSADYRRRGHGKSVSIQLAILGPADATKAEVSRAILEKTHTNRDPDGWEIKIIDWRKQGLSAREINQSKDWRAFSRVIANAGFDISTNRES